MLGIQKSHKNSTGSSYKLITQLPLRLTSYMTIDHLSKLRNEPCYNKCCQGKYGIYLDFTSLSTNILFLFQYPIEDSIWGIS